MHFAANSRAQKPGKLPDCRHGLNMYVRSCGLCPLKANLWIIYRMEPKRLLKAKVYTYILSGSFKETDAVAADTRVGR